MLTPGLYFTLNGYLNQTDYMSISDYSSFMLWNTF